MLDTAWKLIRDLFTVFFDAIYWLVETLLRLNRGLVRTMLPGQKKGVHVIVTYLVVMLEIVGLWVAANGYAATH